MRKCPNCGEKYSGVPALSRKDNETEICPECGMREALESAMNAVVATVEESSATRKEDAKLKDAIAMVKAAIKDKENYLQAFVDGEENDPVMLEGETSEDYYVHMMIDPAVPARIMLKYGYHIYDVLEEEAPSGMWDEIAEEVGLDSVAAVDI